MRTWRELRWAVLAGLVAGVLLGLFLKGVEAITAINVYTLLLNVDFVPMLNELTMSEGIEFTLHLVVSIVLAVALFWLMKIRLWSKSKSMSILLLINVGIGFLLFPLTLLSERTPSIWSGEALLFWLFGHALYGVILGLFFKKSA
ncbi:hypothetical protein [Virgibacillus sp. LDC-1]|uniref:hypothetical protein n=1 Tax=Virgibacillus sp. LDC-1 TaxID=3039856 RepID=UPI0024DE70CB|nr:hypothetical protein [Virgibacillus sp. LDC-1]